MTARDDILVIKLSALGDFVQAMGPFAAIRAHHPGARITLLTTAPMLELAEASPYFDQIWLDARPPVWDLPGVWRLRHRLRQVPFARVYDLQTSARSSRYFALMGRPEWSGIAPGCALPHANPGRDFMHTIPRQAEQLAMAGIATTPAADLSWVKRDLGPFDLPEQFILMVPGGAAHRPKKRWPARNYTALAARLDQPVLLLGGPQDQDAAEQIQGVNVRSLVGRTSLLDMVAIARKAEAAVGNDTGPMHLIAAAGCPSVVLFSAASDPALCAPQGAVTILQAQDLSRLSVETVRAALP